ncbi:GH92 family glycosyl hydrolase [Sunxiuqinia sp. A32]|uniref:GH92 family glycosyl hydrolase n=1 Tax=Sunxiuqinia sp. A32 TaxID=3461496 RepID=UPI0040463BF5
MDYQKICKNCLYAVVIAFSFAISLSSCSPKQTSQETKQPVDYVDPLIGSGGHGHVFVGANVPFGAVQVGPNNIYKGWDWCSGYHYSDSLIIGFSQLHLSGTGIGDLADVLIMPYTGEIRTDKGKQEYPHGGYLSTFSHENEEAKPGYYSVKMDNGVKVELTASERVGFHRYYFPKNEEANIIIDLKEGINDRSTKTTLRQINEYTLVGTRFSSGWAKEQQVNFAIRSSVPIESFRLFENDELLDGISAEGVALKGVVSFVETPEKVEWKVGISPVSTVNALNNIDFEIPDWDFDKVVQSAREKWNNELSKITVETSNESDKRIFYTSAYHSYMHPSLFNDNNGDYQGTDNKIYTNSDFSNYTIFSLWDTYRAAHPLYTLTQPERVNDFISSMLAIYDQQGHLPIWHLNGYETGTMVGISSMQVIAEAYLKGYRDFDVEKAYEALVKTANSDLRGLNYLRDFKPIPSDDKSVHRAVAQALELSMSDGSIALMAKALGHNADYEYFTKRAQNYKLFYEKAVGFFHGINKDGSWSRPFDPLISKHNQATDYAEGNAWQYLWLVPQDVPGLVELLGGEDTFNARLDSFFVLKPEDESEVLVDLTGLIGQYAHGNEPSHHITYLYSYTGQQWKTAEKVRYIMDEFYHDDPDGVIGNEDCGQMSAWYVFSSLGFYPVFPASCEYVFGSPLFDHAEIKLPEGKNFVVEVEGNSDENIYIQSVELNGETYAKNFITHQDIQNGGTLKFVMGATPNANFEKMSKRTAIQ